MRRAALIVFVAVLALAAPANAAFPGKNGKIAFASTRDGNSEIYSMNPDASEQIRLTNNPANDGSPVWSPDGKKIAFLSLRDGPPPNGCAWGPCGVIYVMNADGSNVTRVMSPLDQADIIPAWSPDGSKIAYYGSHLGHSDLWVMNADGSNALPLQVPESGFLKADWSPDGQEIVYDWVDTYCYTPPNEDCRNSYWISKVRPDGTGHTQFTRNGYINEPDWSPDGTRIAFKAGEIRSSSLYTMNRDGSNPVPIGDVAGDLPVWSPDGRKFVFQDDYGIYVMNADGTGATRILANPLSPPYSSNNHPDWQPLPVGPGYARPKGATPFQTYFTLAYKNCTSPNEQHGPPLAVLACSPPQQTSDYATVGTLDANDQPAKSVGSLRLDVKPGNPVTPENEADVKVAFSEKDIRNKSDLFDYTGELLPQATWRDTDKWNGPIGSSNGSEPGTSQDLPMPLAPNSGVPCAATADDTVGSTCNMTTTMNALVIGMVQESRRMNVELGQVQVYDGGADGLGRTTSDNTLFLTQGIFIP
jgi:WD40-like Beta Propeller Repeat